jgi:hypothetical protein
MKAWMMISTVFVTYTNVLAQSSGAVEHYYFTRSEGSEAVYTPIASFTSSNNWYGEARYNYDELNTFSLYGGRTFGREGIFSWNTTPLVGALMGRMTGGSVGMNMGLDYKRLFFSSQSQYSFSFENRTDKYFFHWTELGFEATRWLYAGIAMQQTNISGAQGKIEPGCMVGFSIREWSIPLYAFNTSADERYFVVGVNWQWQSGKKNKKGGDILLAEKSTNNYE